MNKNLSQTLIKMTIFLLITSCFSRPAFATNDAFAKLGRGLTNVATGWAEMGNQPIQMLKDNNPMVAFTGGFVKGIFFAIGRTGMGLYEVLTFPIAKPADYRPVANPPTLFDEPIVNAQIPA